MSNPRVYRHVYRPVCRHVYGGVPQPCFISHGILVMAPGGEPRPCLYGMPARGALPAMPAPWGLQARPIGIADGMGPRARPSGIADGMGPRARPTGIADARVHAVSVLLISDRLDRCLGPVPPDGCPITQMSGHVSTEHTCLWSSARNSARAY